MEREIVIDDVPALEDCDTCARCGEPVMPNMPCTYCTGEWEDESE